MKKIILTSLFFFNTIVISNAQVFIGKHWIVVKSLLIDTKNVYSNNFVTISKTLPYSYSKYKNISLVERDTITNIDTKTLISTVFNDNGICCAEQYSAFSSRNSALAFVKNLIKDKELFYCESTENGLVDLYKTFGNNLISIEALPSTPNSVDVIIINTALISKKSKNK